MMIRPHRKQTRRNALLAALVLFVISSSVYSATWKAHCQNLFWFLRSPSAEVPFEKHQCHAGSCWIHAANGPFEAREGVPLSDSYTLAASQLERALAAVDAIAAAV